MRNAYKPHMYQHDAIDHEKDTGIHPATITRDIVLLIDTSSSMSGARLANTKIAANSFVTQILQNTKNTRIAIVEYADAASVIMNFTKDETS